MVYMYAILHSSVDDTLYWEPIVYAAIDWTSFNGSSAAGLCLLA